MLVICTKFICKLFVKDMTSFFLLIIGCIVAALTVSTQATRKSTDFEQVYSDEHFNPFEESYIFSAEKRRKMFQEKCERNGGPEAFSKVQKVAQCIESLVNYTELVTEMETAKPKGDLDLVFRKYCKKSPLFRECISNFTAAVGPCLEEIEQESKRIIHNITDSLLNFICFKGGDRIALFIAEGGPECFEEKKSGMMKCLNTTYYHYIPKERPSNELPTITLGEKECLDFRVVQNCIVKVLEGCPDPTPANIVDSLFNYAWKSTPCNRIPQGYYSDSSIGIFELTSTYYSTFISLVLIIRATVY